MGIIIYLEGSRAVGKTTLLKNLVKKNPDYVVIDGFSRKEYLFDTNSFEGFVINEKLYLAGAIAQYKVLKNSDTVSVIVKGPYTDVFYAEKVLKEKYSNEMIDEELRRLIEMTKLCKPDEIIYLDAETETILSRAESDEKERKTMSEFMEKWLVDFRNYYISKNAVVIRTDGKSHEEVYSLFMEKIGARDGKNN